MRELLSCLLLLPCMFACGESFTLVLEMESTHADATFSLNGDALSEAPAATGDGFREEIQFDDIAEAQAVIEDVPIAVECWRGAQTCGHFVIEVLRCANEESLGRILEQRIALVFDDDDHAFVGEVECVGTTDSALYIP